MLKLQTILCHILLEKVLICLNQGLYISTFRKSPVCFLKFYISGFLDKSHRVSFPMKKKVLIDIVNKEHVKQTDIYHLVERYKGNPLKVQNKMKNVQIQ